MNKGSIEDTMVGIQRDEWLEQIEKLKQLEGNEQVEEITISTHRPTNKTIVEDNS